MKRNSRLSLALHTLGHMASDPARLRTSADIAAHAGTNAVVVRRVLGKLRKAGLLTSEKGHSGGWALARAPHLITLADVYLELEESLVAGSEEVEASSCSVERALHSRVALALKDIERSLIERLSTTTLAEVQEAAEAPHP